MAATDSVRLARLRGLGSRMLLVAIGLPAELTSRGNAARLPGSEPIFLGMEDLARCRKDVDQRPLVSGVSQ